MDPISQGIVGAALAQSKAKKNNIIAGIQNGQPEYAEKMIKKGFQLVTIGSDQRYMTAASKTAISKLKKNTKKDLGKGY